MKTVINPSYKALREVIERIPLSFDQQGEVVYAGRNVLKKINLGGVDVVVKSFKIPHLVNRIVYSTFRESKAARSYEYSMKLMNHGFHTPEPVAMIEQYKQGLLGHSYYICRYDDGQTVRDLMAGGVAGNEEKLRAFAHYTRALHTKGVLHLDYSPGNILIHQYPDGDYYFSLVDVNRMQVVAQVDAQMVCHNLRRLCISRQVLAYIVKEYAIAANWDAKSLVDLALKQSDRFFMQYIYRRAAKKEKSKSVVPSIFLFRTFRFLRRFLPFSSTLYCFLWERERHIYATYLKQYDYCGLLSSDYTE